MKDLTLKQLRDIAYPGNKPCPPPQEELEAKALHFLRTCKPKAYKELKKLSYLEEAIAMKAEAAIRYAEELIDLGEYEPQAWNRAIRLEILESESD